MARNTTENQRRLRSDGLWILLVVAVALAVFTGAGALQEPGSMEQGAFIGLSAALIPAGLWGFICFITSLSRTGSMTLKEWLDAHDAKEAK